MTESVKIGIVGAGFLAETRARCYARVHAPRAELVAVAARTHEHAEAFAARHAVAKVCDSFEELLREPTLQAVDLCVPNLLHRPFAEAAAAAGKHVICTKPLSAYVGQDLGSRPDESRVAARDRREMLELASADARAMVEAARSAGVLLCYGENWVYAPPIVRACQLAVASGGVVLEMRGWECHDGSHSPYSRSWLQAGGGALLRLGAHPIGAMLHLKRAEGMARDGRPVRPVSVTAEVADLTRNPALSEANTHVATGWKDVESWGCALIAFEDGSRGVAYGSDAMLGGMRSRLELMGSNFHLECQLSPNDQLRAFARDPGVFEGEYLMEKLATKAGWSTPMTDEDQSSGQLAMCQDFAECIASGRAPLADGELGLEVTRVVYAAYASASEGRRVDLD